MLVLWNPWMLILPLLERSLLFLSSNSQIKRTTMLSFPFNNSSSSLPSLAFFLPSFFPFPFLSLPFLPSFFPFPFSLLFFPSLFPFLSSLPLSLFSSSLSLFLPSLPSFPFSLPLLLPSLFPFLSSLPFFPSSLLFSSSLPPFFPISLSLPPFLFFCSQLSTPLPPLWLLT